MNEEKFMQVVAQVMRDDRVLPVNIHIREAWLLVSGLQLATRHPDMPERTRQALVEITHQFEGAIIELHPEAKIALEMGWDHAHDAKPAPSWTKNSRRRH